MGRHPSSCGGLSATVLPQHTSSTGERIRKFFLRDETLSFGEQRFSGLFIAAGRFPALFEMIAGGRLDPARLVTKTIPLEAAGASLAAMDGYTAAGITVIDRF